MKAYLKEVDYKDLYYINITIVYKLKAKKVQLVNANNRTSKTPEE